MRFTKQQSQKIKGGATLLLLFHHLFRSSQRFESGQVIPWILPIGWAPQIGTAARVCVWIFAFISAYGITTIYKKKPTTKSVTAFTFERWISLMQGYWFAYIASALVLTVTHRSALEKYEGNVFYVLSDAMGIADFFGTPTLNGAWWYIFFAQGVVILLPVFILFCKRFGWSSFLITILMMQYISEGISSSYAGVYSNYLPAIILGIVCAQNNFFEHRKRWKGIAGIFQFLLLIAIFAVGCYLRPVLAKDDLPFNSRLLGQVSFSIAALAFCLILFLFVHGPAEKVLLLIGKHSGNIFFVHSLYIAYLSGIIYYTHSILGSWITTLLISLVSSVLMEFVKKVIHYNDVMGKIKEKISNAIEMET